MGRTDVFTSEKRSDVMSRIRSRVNRTTELRVIELLRSEKISGWRRHTNLPGRPDFAFKDLRIALFVDGCFWHGCSKCYRAPKSRKEYWENKLRSNRSRDRSVSKELRRLDWIVIRIWEHELAKNARLPNRFLKHFMKIDPAR